MKRPILIFSVFALVFFLLTSLYRPKPILIKGLFRIQYTQKDKEWLLTRDSLTSNMKMNGFQKLIFDTKAKFTESRNPPCGNDIGWNKTGTYSIVGKQMILNYTSGTINDGRQDSLKRVFVKSKVVYRIDKMSTDTILMTRISGNSEKEVLNPDFAKRY